MSPSQKAAVVELVKSKVKDSITLAIGDGANDVAMIQVRDVPCLPLLPSPPLTPPLPLLVCDCSVIIFLLPRLPTWGWGLVGVRDFRPRWLLTMLLLR